MNGCLTSASLALVLMLGLGLLPGQWLLVVVLTIVLFYALNEKGEFDAGV